MKEKNTNRKGVLILAFALAIIILPLVNADSYQLYCISEGHVLDLPGLCNPAMEQRNGPIQICMHLLNNGKICPTSLNACNSLDLSCEDAGGDGTLDQTPPEMNIFSPQNNEVYSERAVLVDLDPNEESTLSYIDRNDERSGWKKICDDCSRYSRERSFKEGLNNITFKAEDGSGNEAFFDVFFYVDSVNPKISKTEPKSGFASGMFFIEFQESNPESLILNYGNDMTAQREYSVDIENECTEEEGKYKCNFDVDLSDYDEETIDYTFTLTDISGNSVTSKLIMLMVDYSPPVINSLNYNIEGKYVTFTIDISEVNLKEVTYMDNSEARPKEKKLCSGLESNICEKKVSFKDGDHNITINVRDKAGNAAAQDVQFFTDSKKPKISKTEPKSGFASGMFFIEFQEENPVLLTLHYMMLDGSLHNQQGIDLNTCEYLGNNNKYKCDIDVNLASYDGSEIQYWFELKDKVDNTAVSKPIDLPVDITNPVINEITYSMSGANSALITLEVTETNLDKITYLNDDDASPKIKAFCTSLKEGKCSKKITLNPGDNAITFTVHDEAGNIAAENIEISI